MVWPAQLPRPRRQDYSHSVAPRLLRTPMDKGPERRRRLSTEDQNSVPVSLYLTDEQRRIFIDQVWDGIANGGADWFDLPLISDDGSCQEHEVRIDNGYSMTHVRVGGHMCRFTAVFRRRR